MSVPAAALALLLILASVASAQLYEPPVDEVMAANGALGNSLGNCYDNGSFVSGALAPWSSSYHIPVNGSVGVAGMSLMLDNGTYPADGLSVLVARGAQMGRLMSHPGEGYVSTPCDAAAFPGNIPDEAVLPCDFDGDYCVEYEESSGASYAGDAAFTFGNATATVPFSSTLVPVPPDVLDAMKDSSGADQLEVRVTGVITFTYVINDREPAFGSCGDNPVNFTLNLSFSASRNFTVYGTNRLFFLRAPVLREQWFRDNRFDVVVLSQAPLSHADVFLNGNRTRNITVRTFSVSTGACGVREIQSSLSQPAAGTWSESLAPAGSPATPTPLEEANHSFAYVYEFNYSYAGIGENALSLAVRDSFLNSGRYDELITSRMLSYGAYTETGELVNQTGAARPSYSQPPEYLVSMELVLGLLALLFLLSFVNSWLLK